MDLSPYRRRNPFAPYDPNDPQDASADQGTYGPALGPAGGPLPTPPQNVFGPSADMTQSQPKMYTPPPTSIYQPAPPQTDRLKAANTALYGPSQEEAPPPQGTQLGLRRTNLAGDPLMERPQPPKMEDIPVPGIFEPTPQYRAKLEQVKARNAAAMKAYEIESNRYQQEVNARAFGATAPAESQAMFAALANEPDPTKRAAMAQQFLEQSRKFNQSQGGMPALDPLYADTLAHPEKYTPEQIQNIRSAHEADKRFTAPEKQFPRVQSTITTKSRGTVMGSFDSGTGTYYDAAGTPIPPNEITGATKAGAQPGATEEDYQTAAQSLAKYDLTALRSLSSWRGDQRLRLFSMARQINPQFNEAELNRRIKAMDDVTNGKTGLNIQSLGTFLEHAGELSDVIQGISQSNTPALNRPLNWWRRNMTGSPDLQRLLTAIEPVGKEFESFLLNNRALYEEDRKDINRLLDGNMSPTQILATLNQMGRTVNARYNEMNARFKRTTGSNLHDAFPEMFSPEAEGAAQKIGIRLAHQPSATSGYKYTATNRSTGEKMGSNDGKTWEPIR